jgi:hypothetical protein
VSQAKASNGRRRTTSPPAQGEQGGENTVLGLRRGSGDRAVVSTHRYTYHPRQRRTPLPLGVPHTAGSVAAAVMAEARISTTLSVGVGAIARGGNRSVSRIREERKPFGRFRVAEPPSLCRFLTTVFDGIGAHAVDRRIPFVKWGKLLRFDPTEIAAWLDARRVTPRSVSYPLRKIGITRSTSAVAMVDRGLRRHGASS